MTKKRVLWAVGGCGSVALLLLAIAGGGAYLFIDRVGKPLAAEIQSLSGSGTDWSALGRTWQPPAEDADPEALFPASIDEFRRLERVRAAAIALGIEETGWRAVYASGEEAVELFVYRVPRARHQYFVTRVRKAVEDAGGSVNLRSPSDAANPYVWSMIGLRKQRGAAWWSHGWLFVARSRDTSDVESFLATYLRAVGLPPRHN